jgi:serine/threonine-protein kinase
VLWHSDADSTFEAQDLATHTAVAVTIAAPAVTGSPRRAESWTSTGRQLAQIAHPVLLTPRQVTRHGDRPVCVSDLPAGQRLVDRLRRGPVDPRQALRIAAGLADGLAALHAAGLVHGQIRADTVFLDDRGMPHLAAFDLEQGLANHPGPADDLWALRTLTFEMLTGRHPEVDGLVGGASVRANRAQMRHWAPHLGRNLLQWCALLLDPAARTRAETADLLAAELRRLARNRAVPHVRRIDWNRVRMALWRGRLWLGAALATVLGITGGLVYAAARPGTLVLSVQPADARVLVDGKPHTLHNGVLQAQLAGGSHWLRIERDGWKRVSSRVRVDRGDRQVLSVQLLPEIGQLHIDGDSRTRDSHVELLGPRGLRRQSAGVAHFPDLPVGRYQARFLAANCAPLLLQFGVDPRKKTVLHPSPQPLRRRVVGAPDLRPQLAAAGEGLLALPGRRSLRVVDTRGRTLWTRSLPAAASAPARIVDPAGNGAATLLVGLENGLLMCLEAVSGRKVFERVLGGPVRALATGEDLNADELLDVVVGTARGDVFALDGQNGRTLWHARLAERGAWQQCAVGGPLRLAPIQADPAAEVIVPTARPAGVAVLSGKGGRLLWRRRLDAPARTHWQCTLITDENHRAERILLVDSRGTLRCLCPTDGRVLWQRPDRSTATCAPVLCGGPCGGHKRILWTLEGGRLVGLDPATGEQAMTCSVPFGSPSWVGKLGDRAALCVVAGRRGQVVCATASRTQWVFAADQPIRACRALDSRTTVVALLCEDRVVLTHAPVASAGPAPDGRFAASAKWQAIESAAGQVTAD